jgi:PelA/Pel-15E family pectate lyase
MFHKVSSMVFRAIVFASIVFILALQNVPPASAQSTTEKPGSANVVLPSLKILTADRINSLSGLDAELWDAYLTKSQRFAIEERRVLAVELDYLRLAISRPAPSNSKEFELDSKVDADWLSRPETVSLADVVLSYQTPTGGWSKAIDYTEGIRKIGTHWTSQSGAGWHYCGTLDNRSTTEQIRFLALLHSLKPQDKFRDGALRGIRWLLDAQFPNGGWPQVYPLEPGYHEAITLNDSAMLHALEVLQDVASGKSPFDWVSDSIKTEANNAVTKGIDCLRRSQVIIDGKRTVWCAQHDPLTLEPIAARLKEPPSLSGSESADLVKYLMRSAPDVPETRRAIVAAVEWFETHKILGLKQTKNEQGKTDYVLDSASDEVRWARFYDLKSQTPIFAGGQDGVIYSTYGEMAKNNKVGYDYFTTRPKDVVSKELERWKKRIK